MINNGKETMITMNWNGRNGALTGYKIIGENVDDFFSTMPSIRCPHVIDGAILGSCSKADYQKIETAMNEYNAIHSETATETVSRKSTSTRHIELLAVAENTGLDHGKSWTCTEYNIDTKQLNPSWSGLEICYVYTN